MREISQKIQHYQEMESCSNKGSRTMSAQQPMYEVNTGISMLVLLQKEKGLSDCHNTDHIHLLKPFLPLILTKTLVRLEPTWQW